MEDLTRAQLLQRLRACEEEVRIAFDLSGVGQLVVDPETGRFLRVNQAFCKMLGYTERELWELTVRDVSHPDDREIFFHRFYPRIQRGEISEYVIDKRYVHKDGRIVWVAINASMLPDQPGQRRRIAAIIQDITARKEAEAAGLENATKFQAIFENSLDAIAVYEGVFHALVNPAYVKLFGYDREDELIGLPGPELIAPSERERVSENVRRRMLGQFAPSHYITRGLRRDGSEFDLEIHASHFDLSNTRFRLVMLRDVTERLRAEKELRQAHAELEKRVKARTRELTRANRHLQRESRHRQRLEGELWAAAEREQARIGADLHDGLGQQLAGIGYLLSALEMKHQRAFPALGAEMGHIARLLNATVRQTREIARGLTPPELDQGLFAALQKLAAEIERAVPVKCQVLGEPGFPINKSAEKQLYRIAQEAVTNAIRHGNPTQITLEFTTTQETGRLLIRDNGSGFPAGTKPDGGLGLKTTRSRAEFLHGALEIQRAPEGGTLVCCTFPRESAASAETLPHP